MPPGTLQALKGNPDAIVIVVPAALAAGVGGLLDPWIGVVILAVAGGLYHLRCCARERHLIQMEEAKVDSQVATIERVKSPARRLVAEEQRLLPFPEERSQPVPRAPRKRDD